MEYKIKFLKTTDEFEIIVPDPLDESNTIKIKISDYDLYLLIEESNDSFSIDIKVNDEMESINDVSKYIVDKIKSEIAKQENKKNQITELRNQIDSIIEEAITKGDA